MAGPDKILRLRTVLARCGLSRSTIYRKMQVGTFPRQEQISEHCTGWKESEIDRWIANPAAYRQPEGDGAGPGKAVHPYTLLRPN